MIKCKNCDHKNETSQLFCSQCGAELPKQAARAEQNKKTKKTPVLLALAAVLVIALFTGYQMLSKKYSEEAVSSQFIDALAVKNKSALKELIVPDDTRLKVNDASLDALFALLDQNPSMLSDIEQSLSEGSLASPLFSIKPAGKKFGVINQYAVDTPGNFLKVEATGEKTVVTLNGQEIGVIEPAGSTREFGPYLAGLYTLKGVSTIDSGKKEDVEKIALGASGTMTSLALDTGEAKKEEKQEEKKEVVVVEKEPAEKTVIKEVIREVPASGTSGGYYLIAHSDYAPLTYDDISWMSKSDLRLARNEIYARHGYIFDSNDLQNYFSSQSWYYPDPSYDGSLTSVEKANVEFIKSYE